LWKPLPQICSFRNNCYITCLILTNLCKQVLKMFLTEFYVNWQSSSQKCGQKLHMKMKSHLKLTTPNKVIFGSLPLFIFNKDNLWNKKNENLNFRLDFYVLFLCCVIKIFWQTDLKFLKYIKNISKILT